MVKCKQLTPLPLKGLTVLFGYVSSAVQDRDHRSWNWTGRLQQICNRHAYLTTASASIQNTQLRPANRQPTVLGQGRSQAR